MHVLSMFIANILIIEYLLISVLYKSTKESLAVQVFIMIFNFYMHCCAVHSLDNVWHLNKGLLISRLFNYIRNIYACISKFSLPLSIIISNYNPFFVVVNVQINISNVELCINEDQKRWMQVTILGVRPWQLKFTHYIEIVRLNHVNCYFINNSSASDF